MGRHSPGPPGRSGRTSAGSVAGPPSWPPSSCWPTWPASACSSSTNLLGSVFNNPDLGDLWTNKVVNVGTCLLFLAGATAIAYRGITTTEKVQFVLVFFQLGVLILFSVMAFAKAGGPDDPEGLAFSWDWFNPFTGLTLTAFIAGLSASIFSFWGWDSALTVNEESKDAEKTPGRAALLCVVSILLTYLLVSVSSLMYRRRRRHEGSASAIRRDLRQRVRRAGRAGDGHAVEQPAVPGGARVIGGQPDDDVPADHPDHAGDGVLRRLAQALRPHSPHLQDAGLRHRRRRRHRRRVLCRSSGSSPKRC